MTAVFYQLVTKSNSQFQVFFLTVIFGLFHGLVFLPVVLIVLGSNNEVKNLGRPFCANNSIACQIKGRFRKGFLRIRVCLLLALFLSINRKHCLDLKRGSQHRLLCDQCPFSKLLWDNMTARYSNCNDRPSSGTISNAHI